MNLLEVQKTAIERGDKLIAIQERCMKELTSEGPGTFLTASIWRGT